MSGDVQPRKRKDKKKKKEGTSLGNIHESIPTQKFKGRSFDEDSEPTPVIGSIDPGEKIHVHNDHGIGGNICVKIIFFCLFGALVAAVGIIFIHSRGSTDVDLPSVEDSRFADYFTGWLDDAADDHGHDEHELAHDDDNGHDEDEDNHGGGEEEHSAEEATERSEEEEHGGDAAEEASPEADDNEEEENADDDEEEDEDDEKKGVDEDDEDDDGPKFKVVHRFKHFFNQRKQHMREKIVESDVRKKKVVDVADDDDEEEEEEDEEEEEEEEQVVIKRSDLERMRKGNERREIVMRKRSRKEVESVDEDEDEEKVESDEDEEKEESGENIDADEDDEEKEESDEDVEADEDEKKEGSDEDMEADEEEKEKEESGEDMEEVDDDEDKVESDEKAVESEEEDEQEKGDEISAEEEGDDEKDDDISEEEDDHKTPEADIGLNEIDESDEAENEEEKQEQETPSREKEEEEDKKEAVKTKEVEEVESKIIDIEEKLNQILREKRKKVEQRKMELEEIEIESMMEEIREEDAEDDEGSEEEEESYSHGVAVKVIVGIALIVVAHLVLVKKWNSLGSAPPDEKTEVDETKKLRGEDDGNEVTEPVISRRQTLVPEATDLNDFGDEGDEETGEEEEDEEEEEYSEEEEEIEVKDGRKWTVDYPNRTANLSRDEEEFTEDEEDEEEVEDEEELEDEEEEYEEEDMEEDDYGWKRLEPAKMEVEEEEEEVEAPPIPPPRRSHMASGERRGGPQGIEDFAQINKAFDELWDGFDSAYPGEDQSPSGEREEEEEQEKPEEKSEDEVYKEEFRFAEDQLDNNPTVALKKYELILSKIPESLKALTGKAKALDKIAEKERSNQYLREAINAYRTLLTSHGDHLSDEEFLLLSERCIDRMRFRGFFKSAIDVHKGLIRKFPDNPKYRNDLAVTYLFLNDIKSARRQLSETLKIWPKNGFALVHYGFVLKTADNNHAEAVDYLMDGIRTREPGVIDGRFFFHLGDALNRLGRGKEAMEWYDKGVKEGLFLSKYQRSLYNVDRLKGQPWWTHRETTYQDFFKKLEDNWVKIRNEGLSLLNSKGLNLFKEEAENLKDTGDWRQLDLYFRGTRHSNCDLAPFTCSLIAAFPPASSCTRGQVKFSVMLPSTHVWPHCGPTNCRLRSHLGLVVPKNTFIRVAEETRSWEEGKVFVFDDSFEHEVWHNGTGARLVLIVDVWHPELTAKERSFLSPI